MSPTFRTHTLRAVSRSLVRSLGALLCALFALAAGTGEAVAARPMVPRHDADHLDISLGLGLLTVGVGPAIGYRTSSGARLEAGLGTVGVAYGGSVGAGFSPRLYNGSFFTLEAPIAVYALAALVSPIGDESECEGAECGQGSSDGLGAFAVGGGLDMLFGASGMNDARFAVGLRGGVLSLSGWDGEADLLPLVQMNVGMAF